MKTSGAGREFEHALSQHLEILSQSETKWRYPGPMNDVLFDPAYRHKHYGTPASLNCFCVHNVPDDMICELAARSDCHTVGCDTNRIIRRRHGTAASASIHIGRVASASTVMKSGEHRDRLAENEGFLGFEMEGAGVWDNLPSIIIKGVSDYSDSHKNKLWQPFAAATAASAVKAFLTYWKPKGATVDSTHDVSTETRGPSTGIAPDPSVGTVEDSVASLSLAFSPDGTLLATCSKTGPVKLWNLATKTIAKTISFPTSCQLQPRCMAFSPGGKTIACGGYIDVSGGFTTRKRLIIWDTSTGAPKQILGASRLIGWADGWWEGSAINSIAFSPCGTILVSGGIGPPLKTWNPNDGTPHSLIFRDGQFDSGIDVAYSPNGRWLAASRIDGKVNIWNASTGVLERELDLNAKWVAVPIVFSPDSGSLACGSMAHIWLWDPATGQMQRVLSGHHGKIRSLSYSPDGNLLVASSDDKAVRIWNPTNGTLLCTHEGELMGSVAFSPDGKSLATAPEDYEAKIWSVSEAI